MNQPGNFKVDGGLVAVTGATGFLGRILSQAFEELGWTVIRLCRNEVTRTCSNNNGMQVVDFSDAGAIARAISGADAVIHLAGFAHAHFGERFGPQYFAVNRDLTLRVWEAACRAGCKHFMFASSIKVHGEDLSGQVINETSACNPSTPYGQSKLAAENALTARAIPGTPALTILRFPPMYGPGMKGAIRHLFAAARFHAPLPLWGIPARRNFLCAENVALLVQGVLCGDAPVGVYTPHESGSMSPGEVYGAIYSALHGRGLPRFLRWPAPRWLQQIYRRSVRLRALTESFEINSANLATYDKLGFKSTQECLESVAAQLSVGGVPGTEY